MEEQPHAKQIAHAPEPALPSPNPERDAVPIAVDDERPMPNARRERRPGHQKVITTPLNMVGYTAEAIAERRKLVAMIRAMREIVERS